MSSSPQVITCKAAVCWEKGEEAIKVEEIRVDPPKSSEVRIKMLCASICHTDILRAHGHPFPYFPRVLGHEGVGVVESTGDEVTNCKRGDVVIPTVIGECEECENCVSGESNLCLKYPVRRTALMADNTSRMSIRGQMLYQLFTCSTWSEYMVVDANYVIKIDPSIDHAHASLISCGFSTGFGAAWKEAKVVSGSTVAVFGLGAVGLGAISGAKMLGATKIIGIDKNEMKKEKGEAFGMTDFINTSDRSDKSTSELVKEMTGGMGVDYCFECTGAAPLIYETIEASKVGRGKIIVIGAGPQTNVQINIVSLLFGRTLRGSIFGGLKPKSDLPAIIDKCQKKEIPIHELVTHEVSLTDINKAFELLKQPNCVKIIIKI